MAKLVRKTLLQFGSTANAGSEIGQFGSYASPIYSNDPAVMQAGTAWPRGWFAETIATNRPFIQDQNAVDFVFGYMLAYILQMGIPEYDSATTYYLNSMVQIAGQCYTSLQDNNTGNAPATSPSSWQPGIPGTEAAGVVKAYAGVVAPAGYLICDGSAVSRTTYAALFNVCGITFGSGDGSTTFNIPDMRTKVAAGYKAGDDTFGTLGISVGNKTVNLQHNHGGATGGVSFGGGGTLTAGALDTPHTHSIGSDLSATQSIVQPSLTLNHIIKT